MPYGSKEKKTSVSKKTGAPTIMVNAPVNNVQKEADSLLLPCPTIIQKNENHQIENSQISRRNSFRRYKVQKSYNPY